jgi:hypothetical protein
MNLCGSSRREDATAKCEMPPLVSILTQCDSAIANGSLKYDVPRFRYDRSSSRKVSRSTFASRRRTNHAAFGQPLSGIQLQPMPGQHPLCIRRPTMAKASYKRPSRRRSGSGGCHRLCHSPDPVGRKELVSLMGVKPPCSSNQRTWFGRERLPTAAAPAIRCSGHQTRRLVLSC